MLWRREAIVAVIAFGVCIWVVAASGIDTRAAIMQTRFGAYVRGSAVRAVIEHRKSKAMNRLVGFLSGLLLAGAASADSVRCGSKVITEGDLIEKVRQYCGEPTETKRTWMTRKPRFDYGGQEVPFEGTEDVPVDLWTYDFGPNKLVRRIRFVAGKVDSIETREHGTNPR